MKTATRQRVNGMRGTFLVLLAFLHVVGAVGMPLPVVPVGAQSGKVRGGPAYPCQNTERVNTNETNRRQVHRSDQGN